MLRNIATAACLVAALFETDPCWAWGAEGHRIVSQIAADELTSAARRQVEELLGGDASVSMVEASTWADEIRNRRRETARWHFVDIPVESKGYNAARDCPGGDCIVAQIEREERTAGDRSLPVGTRAEALRFLIHFIGDIHQPLHASDHHDRGGNRVRVLLGKRRTNLHELWDVEIVRRLGRSPEEVAVRLEREIGPDVKAKWSAGNPTAWANETFQIAQREIYNHISALDPEAPIILERDYLDAEAGAVREQLEKAGVRLAAELNKLFR